MEIYNKLKRAKEDIEPFIIQKIPDELIEKLLSNINLPKEIKDLILEDSIFFEKILDRYKDITNMYIEKSDTLDNLLTFIQKALIIQLNNINKVKFNKFDKTIYNYLEVNNFFQMRYNETEQNNIIVTKQDIEDYKIQNPNNLFQIKEFNWRDNQKEAISCINNYGFETGIHCQATGTGKSLIILKYIDLMYKKNPKCKIILFTERVSILSDLFDFTNKDIKNRKNYTFWKEHGICDLDIFDIIDRVTTKKSDWINIMNETIKPILLVINRSYLTLTNKYKDIKNLSLILHDECHNVPSNKCYDFLKHIKEIKVPIIGFSATPLRTGTTKKGDVSISNMTRLVEIYGLDNKLKLLTNYNMIYAISNDPPLILAPRFYWFDIETLQTKKQEGKQLSLTEIGSALQVLEDVVKTMHYKKIVAWCGTILLCKEWYEEINKFKERYPNLKNMELFMDLSIKSDAKIKGYTEFKTLETNGIMLCAQKHREGSDISNLDGCIFLDKVKIRGSIPFIQSIGRVLRLDPNKKKLNGIVIDGVVRDDDDYEKVMVDKILGYYFALNDVACIEDVEKDSYKQYITLRDVVEFDKSKKIINLNFNKTKITINCNNLDWKNIITKFESILENKINLNPDEKLKIEFERLKNLIKDKKLYNMKEYEKYAIKNKLVINPKQLYNKFWINYCDFLNINTSKFIINKEKIRELCIKYDIRNKQQFQYSIFEPNKTKIPEDPCEYYKVNKFSYFVGEEEDAFID
jgi:hypothetical protein